MAAENRLSADFFIEIKRKVEKFKQAKFVKDWRRHVGEVGGEDEVEGLEKRMHKICYAGAGHDLSLRVLCSNAMFIVFPEPSQNSTHYQ